MNSADQAIFLSSRPFDPDALDRKILGKKISNPRAAPGIGNAEFAKNAEEKLALSALSASCALVSGAIIETNMLVSALE